MAMLGKSLMILENQVYEGSIGGETFFAALFNEQYPSL